MESMTQSQLKIKATEAAGKILEARDGANFFEEPFRHIVIDNFFDAELAQACLDNFPPLEDPTWHHSKDADIEIKSRTTWKSEFDIPDALAPAIRILNSAPVLLALGQRIGITKLMPDPYFTGGGLNVTTRGGLLDVHIDGNYHDASGLNRRINAIVYLNPGWQKEWGGEFGLYDKTGESCIKEIAPLFNRFIAFDTHDYSFHGLPNALNFPEGSARRSIILYYYTKEPRPTDQIAVSDPHSALWVKRGVTDKHGNKAREFS